MRLGMITHVVILALRRMRQEAQEFKVPLGYVVKTCLGKRKQTKKNQINQNIHSPNHPINLSSQTDFSTSITATGA